MYSERGWGATAFMRQPVTAPGRAAATVEPEVTRPPCEHTIWVGRIPTRRSAASHPRGDGAPSRSPACQWCEGPVHPIEVEVCWRELLRRAQSKPGTPIAVLGMVGVTEDLAEFAIAPDPPAILRRTGAPAAQAAGIGEAGLGGTDRLDDQLMLPPVAEVVEVEETVTDLPGNLLERCRRGTAGPAVRVPGAVLAGRGREHPQVGARPSDDSQRLGVDREQGTTLLAQAMTRVTTTEMARGSEGRDVDRRAEARRREDHRRALRDHLLACLLLLNGLRVSEALALDVEDVSTVRSHRVAQVQRKGGRHQDVVLAPHTATALDDYLETRGGAGAAGPLLATRTGGRLDRFAAHAVIRRLAKAAKIEHAVFPHALRHGFVTAALDAGVPLHRVQDAAGRDPAPPAATTAPAAPSTTTPPTSSPPTSPPERGCARRCRGAQPRRGRTGTMTAMATAWRDLVTSNPAVMHGQACIRGTRIPVSLILGSLADGMTAEEILADYPTLTSEAIRAALAYAAALASEELLPLPERGAEG
jgi:uncharacterized protein (DUF433 family)